MAPSQLFSYQTAYRNATNFSTLFCAVTSRAIADWYRRKKQMAPFTRKRVFGNGGNFLKSNRKASPYSICRFPHKNFAAGLAMRR